MTDIAEANAQLIGLFLECFFTGACCVWGYIIGSDFAGLYIGVYYMYFTQYVAILRRKVHEGMSLWLPAAGILIWVLATCVC